LKKLTDLNAREIWIFAPLVILTIALGVYPKPVLDVLHPSVQKLQEQVLGAPEMMPAPAPQLVQEFKLEEHH
jgi:NADH:ubiquinone oxidoreductase subunit 4 (subunit M)